MPDLDECGRSMEAGEGAGQEGGEEGAGVDQEEGVALVALGPIVSGLAWAQPTW